METVTNKQIRSLREAKGETGESRHLRLERTADFPRLCEMKHSGTFGCPECSMVFRSFGLLDKHKSRFCIGRAAGDPAALRGRRAENAEPVRVEMKTLRPRVAKTPDLIHLRGQKDKLPNERRESDLAHEVNRLRTAAEESSTRGHAEGKVADRERLQEVCEQHDRKLAEIRAHTAELEKQRADIERQMVQVGHDGTSCLREMLHELKELEERNQEALYRPSTQISALRGVKDERVPPDRQEDGRPQRMTFDLVSSVDGPLSSQIGSLQLAYLQSGGSDPELLAQLHDLQAEAYAVERGRPAPEHRTRKKRRVTASRPDLDPSIMAVERENQQLEEQILKLQIDRERRRGGAAASEHSLIQQQQQQQQQHIHQLSSLKTEILKLRRQVEKSRERKTNPPGSLMDRPGVFDPEESLGPAPYDPVSGFVIFYDMVIGVDAVARTLLLVARLFSGDEEAGQSIPMPPVHCQPAETVDHPVRRHDGNYALLAVRQPVHRAQPSPAICLVVEVQLVGSFDLCDQEVCGWAKLQLFDDHNQVQSGFWKLPFRAPPARPTLGSAQLNSVPQLGNMEICLRVANARDGDVQSLVTVGPNNRQQYKYPPTVISSSNRSAERRTPRPKTSQLSSNPFLSSWPQTDHVDPPPKGSSQGSK